MSKKSELLSSIWCPEEDITTFQWNPGQMFYVGETGKYGNVYRFLARKGDFFIADGGYDTDPEDKPGAMSFTREFHFSQCYPLTGYYRKRRVTTRLCNNPNDIVEILNVFNGYVKFRIRFPEGTYCSTAEPVRSVDEFFSPSSYYRMGEIDHKIRCGWKMYDIDGDEMSYSAGMQKYIFNLRIGDTEVYEPPVTVKEMNARAVSRFCFNNDRLFVEHKIRRWAMSKAAVWCAVRTYNGGPWCPAAMLAHGPLQSLDLFSLEIAPLDLSVFNSIRPEEKHAVRIGGTYEPF